MYSRIYVFAYICILVHMYSRTYVFAYICIRVYWSGGGCKPVPRDENFLREGGGRLGRLSSVCLYVRPVLKNV